MDSGTEWAAWFCPWVLPGEALRNKQQVLTRTCPACEARSVPYNCPGLVGSEQAWPSWECDGDGATFKKSLLQGIKECILFLWSAGSLLLLLLCPNAQFRAKGVRRRVWRTELHHGWTSLQQKSLRAPVSSRFCWEHRGGLVPLLKCPRLPERHSYLAQMGQWDGAERSLGRTGKGRSDCLRVEDWATQTMPHRSSHEPVTSPLVPCHPPVNQHTEV